MDIFGTAGNDTLVGTTGDDVITTGGGSDNVSADAGNDLINVTGPIGPGSIFNGGDGSDTIVISTASQTSFGPGVNLAALISATISNIETLRFDSVTGSSVSALIHNGQQFLFTTLEGGAGQDLLVVSVNSGGAYNLRNFSVTNWGANDLIILTGGQTAASLFLSTDNHDGTYILTGGNGADTLNGSAGVEVLNGSLGNDDIDGQGGNDTVNGGDGNDLLEGGDGDDVINGGNGDDTMEGGAGDDQLTGGAGLDVFGPSLGHDTFLDFTPGADKFDLHQLNFTSFAQVQPYLSEVGGNAVFSYLIAGVVNTMTFQGVSLASLTAADFIFSGPFDPYNDHATDAADTLLGLSGNDTINGLGGNDIIFGYDGNDVIDGGDGNDTINAGTGSNTVNAGAGNDTLVLDSALPTPPTQPGIYNGGDGTDTVELHGRATGLISPVGTVVTNYALFNGGLQNVERAVFASEAGEGVGLQLIYHVVTPSATLSFNVPTTLRGGAGYDNVLLVASGGMGTSTEIVMPDFTVSNWRPAARAYQPGDSVILIGAGPQNYVLRASEVSAANGLTQVLIGQGGNDTLIGSAGRDNLNGGAGANTLLGNDGDDVLSIANTLVTPNVTGSGTAFTGLGSTFDGGAGTDWLSVSGEVDFQGMVTSLEGIYLGAAYTSDNTTFASVAPAVLSISGLIMSQFAPNLQLDGTGSIIVNLAIGEDFDGSAFTFANGSSVAFEVHGSEDADTIVGTSRADILIGEEADALAGSDDTLSGGSGDDILFGGIGADTMEGGVGNDTFYVDDAGDLVTDSGGATDLVRTVISYTLGNGVEQLLLDGESGIGGIGNSLANRITGNIAANVLDGRAGDDVLVGLDGNDTISGGTGNDQINGGAGSDTASYSSAAVGVTVNLSLTGAQDTIGAGLDTLNGMENLLGSNQADVLNGNSLANQLDGNRGADMLTGGLGDDVYLVDNAGDQVIEAAGEGTDTIRAAISFTLSNNVEALILEGTANFNGTGNALANTITGNSGNNLINGGAGADTMRGGSGDDTYVVDNAGDTVVELSGGGIDLVQSQVTYTLVGGIENLALTGTLAIDGSGNGLGNAINGNVAANVLNGLGGNDTLNGQGGNDTLLGGAGNDVLIGQNGADTLTGQAGADTFRYLSITESRGALVDTISDFSHTQLDLIDLSAIDAITGGADDAFTLVGAFSGAAGQLVVQTVAAGEYLVRGDIDGDSVADLSIRVLSATALVAGDFVL